MGFISLGSTNDRFATLMREIAEKNNWISKNDSEELQSIVLTIFNDHPEETNRFKNGEKKRDKSWSLNQI